MPTLTFQEIIFTLQRYWAKQGCAILQPYDMEVGAGTSHTATFLRAIGPEPWKVAYVQPSRRPKDGRYGENPNRLQHYYQFQVVLKPAPKNILDLYLDSLRELGFDLTQNDVRLVEDDWENPTLGAWGLGWETWLNGMEVTYHVFSASRRHRLQADHRRNTTAWNAWRCICKAESVSDLTWTKGLRYHDVYHQNEVEQRSTTEEAIPSFCFWRSVSTKRKLTIDRKAGIAAYEQVLKAAHTFNLLDARGAISVTERAAYIGRIRNLSRQVAKAYYDSRKNLNPPFSLAPREWVAQMPDMQESAS